MSRIFYYTLEPGFGLPTYCESLTIEEAAWTQPGKPIVISISLLALDITCAFEAKNLPFTSLYSLFKALHATHHILVFQIYLLLQCMTHFVYHVEDFHRLFSLGICLWNIVEVLVFPIYPQNASYFSFFCMCLCWCNIFMMQYPSRELLEIPLGVAEMWAWKQSANQIWKPRRNLFYGPVMEGYSQQLKQETSERRKKMEADVQEGETSVVWWEKQE